MGRETAYVRCTLHMQFFVLKRNWFASMDSSHALPHLSNYFQVSEKSCGCHLARVRNERLAVRPFFLSIAGSLEGPSVTAAALSFRRLRVMARQAHGKMFEVDLPLYLCDWGTVACQQPLPASHWAAGSDEEKHPPSSFSRAFSCTQREQAGHVVQQHFLKNSKHTSRVCFVSQFLIWPGWIHCELWKALVVLDLENRHSEKGWRWI